MSKQLEELKKKIEICKQTIEKNEDEIAKRKKENYDLNSKVTDLDERRKELIKLKNLILNKERDLKILKNIFKGIILSSIILGLIVFSALFYKNGFSILVSGVLGGVIMTMTGPLFISLLHSNYDEIKKFLNENKLEDIENELIKNANDKIMIFNQIKCNSKIIDDCIAQNKNLEYETTFKTKETHLNSKEIKTEVNQNKLTDEKNDSKIICKQKKIGAKINSTNSNK